MSVRRFGKFRIGLGLTALLFWPGCGGGDDAADEGKTNNNAAPLYTCEICECLPDNSARPGPMYDIIEDVIDAIQGQGDPANTYVGMMPKHFSGFFEVPKLGYIKAQSEIGFLGDYHYPPAREEPVETIVDDQLMWMDGWTNGGDTIPKASVILLDSKSAADLAAPINTALDSGIPVVSWDSDTPDSSRPLHIGALNVPAGRAAGEKMLELIGDNTTGKVLVFNGAEAESNMQERNQGITEAFAAAGREDQLVNFWNTNQTNQVDEMDRALADYGSDFIGMHGTIGDFAGLAADWIVAQDALTWDMKVVAWDANPPTLAAIEDGLVQGTMVQQAYFYGYMTAYIGYSMAALGIDKTMDVLAPYLSAGNDGILDTGMVILTPENLADFKTYQSTCFGVTL